MTEKQRFYAMADALYEQGRRDWYCEWLKAQLQGDLEPVKFMLEHAEPASGPFADWARDAVPESRLLSTEPWYRALADRLAADLQAH